VLRRATSYTPTTQNGSANGSEATTLVGDELGQDGLMSIARGLDATSTEVFGAQLTAAISRFRAGGEPLDDRTIIVLRRNNARWCPSTKHRSLRTATASLGRKKPLRRSPRLSSTRMSFDRRCLNLECAFMRAMFLLLVAGIVVSSSR
jgi:hypothetical protein